MYYDYNERISTLASHRIMAIDRAEKEKVIQVSIDFDEDYQLNWAIQRFTKKRQCPAVPYIEEAVQDGLKRLAFPSVEREIRNELKMCIRDRVNRKKWNASYICCYGYNYKISMRFFDDDEGKTET